jgi:centromere-localized protein 2
VAKHNINTIIPELDSSVEELDAAIQSLEKEEAELLQSIKQTVGSMSDLRYGRLSNGQLRKQVLEGLQIVQETCGTR